MLTLSDLMREFARTFLEVTTIVASGLLVAGLIAWRRAVLESRRALRLGIRKRSQLR
jgi:hypothetical protein